ncbi:hypothetical protein [Sphingomonas sp. G-3-2-10]|nr:hypothetical protein [Sphingomonas sp. G-3-2-10]
MTHWDYVTAAYVVTIAGTVGLAIASYVAMRRAEAAAEELKRK